MIFLISYIKEYEDFIKYMKLEYLDNFTIFLGSCFLKS